MINLYNKTESSFNHNGLAILDGNIVSPVVSEELNGLFSFEFDYPIYAPHSDELLPEMIVKAPVPELADQLFCSYTKKMDYFYSVRKMKV